MLNPAWTTVPCPLGSLLLAATDRGICALTLGDDAGQLEAILKRDYPLARLVRNDHPLLQTWIKVVLGRLDGEAFLIDLPIDVQATAFQRQVWRELRAIPPGTTRTYQEIARRIGNPKAVRAVAQACAANPVAVVIPCHRVVRSDGTLGGYRWGIDRKKRLLEIERQVR
jgi:AraC family transcriptional regulator of adaptative response/methylated-DNA-[protein]-cysteine methyltransferase